MADQNSGDIPKAGAPTRRLYFEDAYLREFDAEVLETRSREGKPALVLDRTCFYPESGGQPSDKGEIDGVEVLEVVDEDGVILHVMAAGVAGPAVHGRIDWPTRFGHMQQHTGQHILSQAFFEILKGETVGFHLGPEVSTLEIGLPSVPDEALDRVEDRACAVVWEDLEVKTSFVPEERIGEVPLRRPPKKHGLLRVVEVSGYDYSACGGTHCRRSGEVGLIKIIGVERIRGRLRFTFVCGGRALADYRRKDREIHRLAAGFSSADREVAVQVERLSADHKALKKRAGRLEERLAAFEAREAAAGAAGPVIAEIFGDKTAVEARFLALGIIRSGEFAVVLATSGEGQGHIILARSEAYAVDLRGLIPVLGARLEVKGGGGPSLVELVTPEVGKLGEAVEAARAWLEASEAKLRPA